MYARAYLTKFIAARLDVPRSVLPVPGFRISGGCEPLEVPAARAGETGGRGGTEGVDR